MAVVGDDAMIGQLVHGRYRIVEFIARGGMASVFRAQDTRLDREVAVKIMHQGLGDPEQFTERFQREAKSAARLNHRNVVAVFDQGSDGPITYLVMELVPGRTLRDVMRHESPMPTLRALDLVEQVLIALVAAHDAGIVHRDIKPENVLITPDGNVKVADFGLARAVSASTTATGKTLIGTVSYLAPEVVVNAGTDARSDVYAVGAMTYEMLTGVKPHHADTPIQVAYKHVHEDIGPPSDARPGLPDYVDALVARATSRDRDRRSADARVLLQQLRQVQHALREGVEDDPELAADLRPSLVPPPSVDGDEDTAPVGPASGAGEGVDTELVAGSAGVGTSTMVLGGATARPPAPPGQDPSRGAPSPPRRPEPRTAAPQPPGNDRQHSKRGRVLLVLALLLTLLAGLGGWYFGIGRYDPAPSLVNMSEQQAKAEAEEAGYSFSVDSRDFSETVPLGTVISTSPGPGDRILPGDTIDAVISKGPERYVVPDLRGQTPEAAETILADTKLELGDVAESYDQEVPAGQIIGVQGVAVGDQVKRDTAIDVIVSLGREPLDVNDYTGQSKDAATSGLTSDGFVPQVQEQFSETVAAGIVISQNPNGGQALRGDPVTIVVSKGPELFAVPNVVGMKKDEAIRTLEAAGFVPDAASFGNNRNYTVIGQTPSGGSQQKKGTTVSFFGV
ncbi:Stk1 family PASTA domain-containing Ser/Thr kinase [Aeromicrobium sp. Leaf350]|uniref:Stk1 family PASTA domain-containing Ser/Thr kinase n=1 Tax=Aeromicrobium sp. Leaf350 TaxID=2876565 RepID=UPI001E4A49EC|nr:Stk1 family PASTA domain-containing Ser/Thr kinase [Aeromicrobium sp. Leaf350]